MKATPEQIKTLDALQEVDRQRIKAKRELTNLPQKEAIEQLREKRRELAEKTLQLDALLESAEKALSALNEEDEQIVQKEAATQLKIDEAQGDYRSVTSLTRDLEGMQKRRETLEFEMNKADAKLCQVKTVCDKAHAAERVLADKETAAIGEMNAHVSDLQSVIDSQTAARESLAANLPEEMIDAYDRAVKRCGGVGVSHLRDGMCSACRHGIDNNRLLQLRVDAPIAQCPACHRLLVIE